MCFPHTEHPTQVHFNDAKLGDIKPETMVPRHATYKVRGAGGEDGVDGWYFHQKPPPDCGLTLTRRKTTEKSGFLPLGCTTCGCPYCLCGPVCLSAGKINRNFGILHQSVAASDINPLIDEMDDILLRTHCPSCTRWFTFFCCSIAVDYRLMRRRWELLQAAVDKWNAAQGAQKNVCFDLAFNPGGLHEPDLDIAYLFDKSRPYLHKPVPFQTLCIMSAPILIPGVNGHVANNVPVPQGYALALVPIGGSDSVVHPV